MQTLINYKEIEIPVVTVHLKANLVLVENAKGIILFSHGSGSSRLSPRNNYVAQVLQQKGFSTLLFDLLTPLEDEVYENRFDIELLTDRLVEVTKWVQQYPDTKNLSIGYFGASTGAASALKAAAKLGPKIKAIVSRGGRPDLALEVLNRVKSPTLLIVGDLDNLVIPLNEKAFQILGGFSQMKLIENATHLFSESGKLEEVADLAAKWFDKYLD
jgi:pimeloyl-ACP methyl ester carboxylesterase